MRVKNSFVTNQRRKKWIKLAKGYWGHKSIAFKHAKQAVFRSWTYAFRDRKDLKQLYRRLWIARINAAVRPQGLNYSTFISKLKKANVQLNRKMISELAIQHPETFNKLVALAKSTK